MTAPIHRQVTYTARTWDEDGIDRQYSPNRCSARQLSIYGRSPMSYPCSNIITVCPGMCVAGGEVEYTQNDYHAERQLTWSAERTADDMYGCCMHATLVHSHLAHPQCALEWCACDRNSLTMAVVSIPPSVCTPASTAVSVSVRQTMPHTSTHMHASAKQHHMQLHCVILTYICLPV